MWLNAITSSVLGFQVLSLLCSPLFCTPRWKPKLGHVYGRIMVEQPEVNIAITTGHSGGRSDHVKADDADTNLRLCFGHMSEQRLRAVEATKNKIQHEGKRKDGEAVQGYPQVLTLQIYFVDRTSWSIVILTFWLTYFSLHRKIPETILQTALGSFILPIKQPSKTPQKTMAW